MFCIITQVLSTTVGCGRTIDDAFDDHGCDSVDTIYAAIVAARSKKASLRLWARGVTLGIVQDVGDTYHRTLEFDEGPFAFSCCMACDAEASAVRHASLAWLLMCRYRNATPAALDTHPQRLLSAIRTRLPRGSLPGQCTSLPTS